MMFWLTLSVMFAFALVHSWMAGGLKSIIRRRFGERAFHGLYRITYNLVSVLTVIPIGLLLVFGRGEVVWTLPEQILPLTLVLQAIGAIGFVISILQVDQGQFMGLAQMRAYFAGQPLPLPPEPLQQRGMYQLVRHPLYLFSIMVQWPLPIMTETWLAFNIGATLYFLIGSRLEERRLLGIFGEEYRAYQRRVPWLLPLPRPRL
jgi:protein-S-isoprenylcysteine O-methyltransferase Ste14